MNLQLNPGEISKTILIALASILTFLAASIAQETKDLREDLTEVQTVQQVRNETLKGIDYRLSRIQKDLQALKEGRSE